MLRRESPDPTRSNGAVVLSGAAVVIAAASLVYQIYESHKADRDRQEAKQHESDDRKFMLEQARETLLRQKNQSELRDTQFRERMSQTPNPTGSDFAEKTAIDAEKESISRQIEKVEARLKAIDQSGAKKPRKKRLHDLLMPAEPFANVSYFEANEWPKIVDFYTRGIRQCFRQVDPGIEMSRLDPDRAPHCKIDETIAALNDGIDPIGVVNFSEVLRQRRYELRQHDRISGQNILTYVNERGMASKLSCTETPQEPDCNPAAIDSYVRNLGYEGGWEEFSARTRTTAVKPKEEERSPLDRTTSLGLALKRMQARNEKIELSAGPR